MLNLNTVVVFLGGGTAAAIVGHAVNTFPTPSNKYGAWLLGVIQFAIGQRVAAKNTLGGMDTVAYGRDLSLRP